MTIKKLLVKKIIVPVAIIVSAFLSYWGFRSNAKLHFEEIVAARGVITQEVSVTGITKPTDNTDLAFEKSGRIVRVNADVGDRVSAGEIIVQLDTSELAAQLSQARANILTEQAKLDALTRGTRPEDIAIVQTQLAQSEQDLANDYDGILTIVNDSYSKASDAVRNQINAIFTNGETSNPQLTYSANDAQAQIDAQSQRVAASTELNNWNNELNSLGQTPTRNVLDSAIKNSESHLAKILAFLNRTMDTLSNSTLTNTTVLSYKTSLTTAISEINTGLTNVNTKDQNISSQKITVKQSHDQLSLKLAGSRPEDIEAQTAQLSQAKASAALVAAQIEKTALKSPINGVVTRQDAKIGEIAAANSVLVSIISENKLQFEANVPEADIAKVKIGDSAKVTLDAYGSDVVFGATAISIDPAETMIEGVATYKTKFQMAKEDERIKPGMTANINILTDRRENVVIVPRRAVTTKDGGNKFVLVDTGGSKTVERSVKTGLRGSDGNIEITEGLRENEKVIIPKLE